jgi:hypothetical protein
LQQQTVAHRLAVGLGRLNVLVELGACLTPDPERGGVTAARMLSPEQSTNCLACMVCHVWLVSCHAFTDTMVSPSISASVQEQLSNGVRLGWKRTLPHSTASQTE